MQKLGNFIPFLLYSIFIHLNVVSGETPASVNPFTPKAYAARYWKNHITNNLPQPSFLFDKASQLTAAESASFTKLAAQNALSTQLPKFCSSAKLFCFPNLTASLDEHKGNSVNNGTDHNFICYGCDGSNGEEIGIKIYGDTKIFNAYKFRLYAKDGISFSKHRNESSSSKFSTSATTSMSEQHVKNRWVEPGMFFREEMLKTGNVMPMPDIRDKMPKRSFLPRAISSVLPFSTSRISEMKKIFHADEDSAMAKILTETLTECERAPAKDETKRCVGSMEDMIDFATSVLGGNAVVRTTQNTNGSNQNVMIGTVKGINGGKVTKTVSCHQSLFPYLVYYCHSVPKVRVYEADILDPESRVKINHGVAICHVDTSAWGATHEAFLALGLGPGKIEVCHWIFENDMNWAIAD